MSGKTTPDDRRTFYERHQRGETYAEIAQAAGVSLGCVRYWCRRLRDGGSCVTHYPGRPPGLLQRFSPLVRYVLLRLRLEHPRWGASRLRYGLAHRPALAHQALPSVAQIGRYLRQWPRRQPPRRTRPLAARRPNTPTRVHQRWQVDFKLGVALADGSQVTLHTVCDPVGEVCVMARVTPAGRAGQAPAHVTLRQLQATLRAGFAYWHTLPEEVQTDNEAVFIGHPNWPFPSPFTLWLVGLGIRQVRSRPGRPTDNAEVERCHQTVYNYALCGNEQRNCAELQDVLDRAVAELAFDLPSRAPGCAGRPPAQAHPELLQPTRLFAPEHEWSQFDCARVDAFLAQQAWQRRVGATGQITLGGRRQRYAVGRAYAGQTIWVGFDPEDRHFVFYAAAMPHLELGRRPARGLSQAELLGFDDPTSYAWPQQLPLFALHEGVSC